MGIVVAVGQRGLGKESPEKAIYALAHDHEHGDGEGVCARLFPSTYLDPHLARELGVPSEDSASAQTWKAGRQQCERDFGASREFESFDFREPRVHSIRMVPIHPSAGVTRAAKASVSLDGRKAQPVHLVEYKGDWTLLLVVK
jgi:hypothetical protein